MPRRRLIIPKREEALAFAKGDILLSNNHDSKSSSKQESKKETMQTSKLATEPIFARVSPEVYEGVCTALAKAKAKKTGPRKLQQLVDEALREWLERRGYLEQNAA
jgi:hypothetical protein